MRKIIPALVLAGALVVGTGQPVAAAGEAANCVGELVSTSAGPGFGLSMSLWAGGRDGDSGRAAGYRSTGGSLTEMVGSAASSDTCSEFGTP